MSRPLPRAARRTSVLPALAIAVGIGCVLARWIGSGTAWAAESRGFSADRRPAVRAFLADHCGKCHGADVQEGGVRVDDLPLAIDTVEVAERWQKVLNVLNAGDMPPDDEPQPKAEAKTDFLAVLSAALVDARKAIGDQGRIATLRRLNRREYANTLRSLLDVEVDVSNLPDDKGAGSFDTIGSSLFMSSDQFEQYLAIGRRAAAQAVGRWQRASESPPPVRKERKETEIAARNRMAGLLSGYFLEGYRKGKEWQASGGDPARAKDFGFADEHDAKFRIWTYEHHAPYLGQYLSMPWGDTGAWLAYYSNNYHIQETISVPPDAPDGRYVLRVRAGFNDKVPVARRFLEMGFSRGTGADDFEVVKVFQVTGPVYQPMTLEIPVTISPGAPRTYYFREKRHVGNADFFQFELAFVSNGVGPMPALWTDWVEWEGPVADPAAVDRGLAIFGTACPGEPDAATVTTILEHFATRAFRGVKPQGSYLKRLLAVYEGQRAAGKSAVESLVEPMAVILASPAFLYLNEPVAVAVPKAKAESKTKTKAKSASKGSGTREVDRTLSDLELASRLSYFLWAAPPDDALLAAAAAGDLRSPEALAKQTQRMLADPRSFELARGFTHQWLNVDRLDFFRFDYQLYPDFDESTREAAKAEIYHTFHTLLKENLDARRLLKNDFVVVNGLLAAYYGLEEITGPVKPMPIIGDAFRKVVLPAGSPRGGLLGMAAVLGMGSNGERTSPVERGAWVLRKLLNDPPPPAPANVPQLSRLDGKKITTPERMRMHQEEPQCAQCHRVIDPIGFGMENFDAGGKWRTEEHVYKRVHVNGGPIGKGVDATFPIDPSGSFYGGPTFKDFFELRERIVDRGDDFLRGLIENLYAYALGRPVSFADAETIDGLVAQAKADEGRLASLIQAIVATSEFRTK